MRAGAGGVGIRKICGALRAADVPFTWHAVATALATLDPVGRDRRYRHRVPRVHYNVHTANGMWHVDGYEHLVAWNICEDTFLPLVACPLPHSTAPLRCPFFLQTSRAPSTAARARSSRCTQWTTSLQRPWAPSSSAPSSSTACRTSCAPTAVPRTCTWSATPRCCATPATRLSTSRALRALARIAVAVHISLAHSPRLPPLLVPCHGRTRNQRIEVCYFRLLDAALLPA